MEVNALSDRDHIRQAVQLILAPAWDRGDVAELRALGTTKGTVSGYFDSDHQEELIEAAVRLSGNADGIYVTLNPVLNDCLARAANRTVNYAKHAIGDLEITQRLWLLIDTDPKRPKGISSTDAEHGLALERARQIRAWLLEKGCSDVILADSGNGGHLLGRIDLPADDGGLLQRLLKVLHEKFSDENVEVDTRVSNASRITKLYGTLACKGDSVPDRPHRIARLLDVPEKIVVTPREVLESIVAETSGTATVPRSNGQQIDPDARDFNVADYLQSHGIEVGRSKPYADGGTLWELKRCPWQPEKSGGGPFVIQFGNGGITAGCHHPPCEGKGWSDLLDLIAPDRMKKAGKKGTKKGPSVAQQIVALATEDELFHTAEKEAFVTINRRQTWRVDDDSYRLILRGRLHEHGIVATKSALDDAVATLESKAIFDGPEYCVHVRSAQDGDNIYIDLCNDNWEAVTITSKGFSIVVDPPVRFVRYPGMLPLPTPVEGGNVSELRGFINVTDEDWPLVVSWLMAAIRPTGPFPILVVNGEHGSCKSTTCRRLRSLVDPNSVALRDTPKNEQTLMIWAKHAHVIALDNLSSMSKDLSNAMCRLSTGGGHSERANYTDDGEALFYSIRPQIVNGISDFATRSDFLDRALVVNLPVVPKSARKTEKELDARFAEVHASIFGALLTAAAHGLSRLPEVEELDIDLPRLADFAHWMIAVESALGWEQGTFLKAINRSEDQSHELAIADSPVAQEVRRFVKKKREYDGPWERLLAELNKFAGRATKRRDGWPKNGQALSGKVRERAQNLRGVGISVEFHDNDRPKRVTLKPALPPPREVLDAGTSPYLSVSQVAAYGNDGWLVETTLLNLIRFWNAPPLAAFVAAIAEF